MIFDVQRAGPRPAMPTRTAVGHLTCAYASHGDTKHVLLLPEGPGECFEFGALAFEPRRPLLDGTASRHARPRHGHERWLTAPFQWDDARRYDRGKVMTAEMLEAGTDFGRYLDVDGDGIPYRTLPATHPDKGAYFTRGTSRDRYARYSEEGAVYVDNMERLLRKFDTAKALVPAPLSRRAKKRTPYGVIFYGSTSPAMDEGAGAAGAQGSHRRHARPRLPVLRRVCSISSGPTTWSSSSSRTATPSCAGC